MTEKRHPLPPIHPGQILKEDLDDAGVSMNRLARDIRVPMNRVSEIVNGKRAITADTALRLARYFGTSAHYWLNLQTAYDLQLATRESGERIQHEVLPLHAA
jgi:addiction module HigA family antidote